jgi:hypothetical protein
MKAERGPADEIRVKPICREWTFLLYESLSQRPLSGFPKEHSSEWDDAKPIVVASEPRSSERSERATTEGGIQGRRTCCGESRSSTREGETSESSNPIGGFSMRQG